MPPLAYWVHDLSPFLIRFGDNFGVRYYGLAYLAGFASGLWLLWRYTKAGLTPLKPGQVADLFTWLVAGVVIGGRVGYFALYAPRELLADPLALFRVWEGGMASHGGFVGVALALAWFARRERLPVLHLGDLVTSAAPAGLLFGRLANFINGELWGKVTDVPWAVIFPASAPGVPPEFIAPRHPSQLYAAALEGALMLAVMQVAAWRTSVFKNHVGRAAGVFFVGYAIMRSVDELFREPDAGLILGLSRGTFYSLFVLAAGVWLIVRKSRPLTPPPPPGRS